jgi:hypothetical protein
VKLRRASDHDHVATSFERLLQDLDVYRRSTAEARAAAMRQGDLGARRACEARLKAVDAIRAKVVEISDEWASIEATECADPEPVSRQERGTRAGSTRTRPQPTAEEIDQLLVGTPGPVGALFRQLHPLVMDLAGPDGIEASGSSHSRYMGYAPPHECNFCYLQLQQQCVVAKLRAGPGELRDPRGTLEALKGPFGDQTPAVRIRPGDDIDYALSLIRQAYDLRV